MDLIVVAHVTLALLLLVACLVVGSWGLARARVIGGAAQTRESRVYAHAVQASHTLVAATGLLGVVLLVEGHAMQDPLHARVYGPFMVVAIVAAYGFRTGDRATNVRVFAWCAIAILGLGLRAATTGG